MIERDLLGSNVVSDVGAHLLEELFGRQFLEQGQIEIIDDPLMELELLDSGYASEQPLPSTPGGARNSPRGRRLKPTQTSAATFGRPSGRSSIPLAPVGWVSTNSRWLIPYYGYAGWTGCGSPTRPSCLRSCPRTPTRPCWRSPNGRRRSCKANQPLRHERASAWYTFRNTYHAPVAATQKAPVR